MPTVAVLALGAALLAAPPVRGDPAADVSLAPDSAPGWFPSDDQQKRVPELVTEYFADRDSGKIAEAYAFQGEDLTQNYPLDLFSAREVAFNDLAGAIRERRIVKIVWAKDPMNAESPGVYATVDFVGRFANVDRYCGYVVLHQATSSADFKIVRDDETYLSNSTAAAIEANQSRGTLDAAWDAASSRCPNYPGEADQTTAPAEPAAPPPGPAATPEPSAPPQSAPSPEPSAPLETAPPQPAAPAAPSSETPHS